MSKYKGKVLNQIKLQVMYKLLQNKQLAACGELEAGAPQATFNEASIC